MTTWTVYTDLSNKLLDPFNGVIDFWHNVAAPLKALIILGLTIKIIWIGYETMRGKGSSNIFLDIFSQSLRAILVIALGLTAYDVNVYPLFDQLFGWLGNVFNPTSVVQGIGSTTDASSLFTALDNSVNTAFDTFKKIYVFGFDSKNFSFWDGNFNGLWMIFSGALMVAGFFIYTLVAFYNLFFIKLSLIFLYGIGPLFIACLAFESLQKFFDGWVSAVLRYGMTGVIITMVTGAANKLMTKYATDLAAKDLHTMDYFMLGGTALVGMLILAKFTEKVPELAGAMMGSLGLNIATPSMGGVTSAAGIAAGAAKSAYQVARHPIQSAKAAYNAAMSPVRGAQGIYRDVKNTLGGGGNSVSPGRDPVLDSISKSMKDFPAGGTGTISGSRPSGTPMQSMLSPKPHGFPPLV